MVFSLLYKIAQIWLVRLHQLHIQFMALNRASSYLQLRAFSFSYTTRNLHLASQCQKACKHNNCSDAFQNPDLVVFFIYVFKHTFLRLLDVLALFYLGVEVLSLLLKLELLLLDKFILIFDMLDHLLIKRAIGVKQLLELLIFLSQGVILINE